MIIVDLSGGVSFSLLLKIAFEIAPERLTALIDKTALWEKTDISRALSTSLEQKTPDQMIVALNEACRRIRPIEVKQALLFDPELEIKAVIDRAKVKNLDPFDFCAYIALTVFMHGQAARWQILAPGIGTDSDANVYSILQASTMIVSSASPPVSPLLALYLYHQWAPFAVSSTPSMIDHIVEYHDPVAPELYSRVFFTGATGGQEDEVAVIEANIDDMTPEILAHAMQVLLDNGALDYTVIPVTMKKGRVGFQVQVLCQPEKQAGLEEMILLHTSTFGVRSMRARRRILSRSIENFESSYGRIRIKKGFNNGRFVRSVPEFEDLALLSRTRNIPLMTIYSDITAEINRTEISNPTDEEQV